MPLAGSSASGLGRRCRTAGKQGGGGAGWYFAGAGIPVLRLETCNRGLESKEGGKEGAKEGKELRARG